MAVEWEAAQKAMYALMAEQGIVEVEPLETSQNDFSALPEYTSTVRGFVHLLYYLTKAPNYFYCWDKTGTITRQDKEAKPGCP